MILYDDFDIQVIQRGEQFFLCYPEGGIAERFNEIEISKEDAESIIQDVQNALQIVWDYQNKLWGLI